MKERIINVLGFHDDKKKKEDIIALNKSGQNFLLWSRNYDYTQRNKNLGSTKN